MPDPMIYFRQVQLLGPERDKTTRVWRAQLQLAHPLRASGQDAIIRNHSIRLLAQHAEPASEAIEQQHPVMFHEPVLLAAAATTENYVGADSAVHVLDASFAPVELKASDGWRVYSEVRLVPASEWPPASGFKRSPRTGKFELSAPPLCVTQGAIRVGYAPQFDNAPEAKRLSHRVGLKIPANDRATIFGSLRIDQTKTVKTYGTPPRTLPAIAFDLTPNGVEFWLDVPSPFAVAETWLKLRLRLEATVDRTNPEMVLRLVGGQPKDLAELSRGLAWMSHDLAEREGAIVLQINETTVPPLMWPLELKDGVYMATGPVPAVRIAPDGVVARLLTPQDIDGGEIGVAEFLRPRAELGARNVGGKLHLKVAAASGEAEGTVPAGAYVTLTWTQAAGAGGLELQPDKVAIAGSSNTTEFAGTVDTDALAERLTGLWSSTLATTADDRPPFAFLALERGWLQLPLPPAKDDRPPPVARARSAFNGFIRVDFPRRAAAAGPDVRHTLPGLYILSARRVDADITWDTPFQSSPRAVVVTLAGAAGTVSGVLWAGEASPTPVEILPSLAAGPAALASVPITFGGTDESGWRLKIAMDDTRPHTIALTRPDNLPTLAWLAHDSQALVASVAMTRTAENALRPSTTRELVPIEIKADTLTLTFDNSRLPRLTTTSATPHGIDDWRWPWPPIKAVRPGTTPSSPVEAAGVPLVSLTAAGIEFTVGNELSAGFPTLHFSLRYDLPLLDELFANAKAPEPKGEQKADAKEQTADAKAPEVIPTDVPPTALDLLRLAEAWAENARRLARARTDADRVILSGGDDTPTLWHPVGGDVQHTRVDGLFEPYRWRPNLVGFRGRTGTLDIDLGTYRLGGDKWRFGGATLGGFDGRFEINGNTLTLNPNGDVNVAGFAADTRKDGTWRQDTRGLALAAESTQSPLLRYRDAKLQGPAATDALRLATLKQPIRVEIGGEAAQFWFRDLPLKAEAGKLVFDASGGLENAPGPDPAALNSRHLPVALYEWRFCRTNRSNYELPLGGPLAFRPLRLAALQLNPDGTPLRLEIVGSVQIALASGKRSAKGEPFGPERAYATGNLVRLSFTTSGQDLVLAAIERVAYDANGRSFKRATAALSFVVETRVSTHPGGPDERVRGDIRLHLASTTTGTLPKLTKTEFHIRLFGQDCQLSTDKTSIDAAGLHATFSGEPGDILALSELALDWSTTPGELPRLAISVGRLSVPLHVDAKAPRAFERTYGAAHDMRWLDLKALEAKEKIDHANGVVTITLETDLAADSALFRGFLLPAGKLCASIALVFRPSRDDAPWPAPALGSAIGEFVFDAAQPSTPTSQRITAVRHRHIGDIDEKTVPPKVDWTSRLLIDALFASDRSASTRSTIEWPVGGLTLATTFNPKPDKPETWKTELRADPDALVLEHYVRPRLCAHELEVENLVREANEIVLDRPWRVRAAVDHIIAPQGGAPWPGGGTGQLEWSSVDELVLIDMGRLVQAARTDAKTPPGRNEPYAFLARYQSGHEEIRVAGVVRRTLAGAGFPVRRILRAVRDAYPENEAPPKSLLLTGASVTDIAIPNLALDAPNERILGVTLVPQWILPWVTVTGAHPADGIRPLDRIPQIDAQPSSYEISAYDAASGTPRPLDGAPAASLGAQDGTQSLIETRLRALAGNKPLFHLTPVDQTFVVRPDPTIIDASLLERDDYPPLLTRPLMVRTLLALKTVADRFAKAKAQEWREGIACIVGRTDKGREIRLAVSAWADNVATQDGATPTVTLIMMDRDGVKIEVLPESLAATLVDPAGPGLLADGGERADAMLRALSLSAEPLLVVLGRMDPSYTTIRIPEARGDLSNRTGGPAELRGLPPHVAWVPIAAPPATLTKVERRVLRERAETLYASAALGWPETGNTPELAAAQARLGDEEVRRAKETAWAGRVRSLAWPAKAWAGEAEPGQDPEFKTAAFVAMGQRVALRRAAARNLRTPPDRVSVIAPPRVRAPLTTALVEAMSPARTPSGSPGSRRSRLAPMLPGGVEVTVTGQRPGVLLTQHEGVLIAREDNCFDPAFERFGRPASRGPLVVRQLRAPRSSALPEESELDERRKTFVASDEKTGNDLKPFKLLQGPALVVRYETTVAGHKTKGPAAITFSFEKPRFGWLASDWNGKIELIAGVPEGSARDALAHIGLLVDELAAPIPKLRAQLQVGATSIDMKTLDWREASATSVLLSFETDDFELARIALRHASADTPVRLTIRCRAQGPATSAAHITLGTKDTQDPLVPGPPRVLTFDLPHVPAERRWIPVSTFTLAFGDPAYDRELGSPTWTGKAVIDDVPHILATDRAEYDRSATIHFAFWKQESEPVSGNWKLSVAVQPGDGAPGRALKLAGISPLLPENRYAVLSMMPYAIPIPALRETDNTPAKLLPGDRLQFAVTGPVDGISLTVGLVAEPVLPPPAATYGLAVLRGGASIATALFATAPLPQSIEFPSLLADLVAGHVRRRALFLWSFATSRPPEPGAPYAYLVKVDRTGGGQLPNSRADFLPYEV